MRLTTVILIACLMQVSAAGLAQKITIHKSKAQLEVVLNELRKQTGFDFIYTDKQIRNSKPVTINVKDAELEDALTQIFSDQPLMFSVDSKTVVLKEKTPSFLDNALVIQSFAKDLIIRGKILDETGKPLEGATIVLKGTNRTAKTDAKGEFVLANVPDDGVLVIRYVGYKQLEISLKDAVMPLEIKLNVATGELEEVKVVYNTGYQELNKERATGSFVQIDNELFNRRVGATVLERISDLVPGLLATRPSAYPLDDIIIRGVSTLNGNKRPLLVVNNFIYEGNPNDLNPNDVENITVLKDAAAASIWGARAGNGVIVITMKKGKMNSAPVISFTANSTLVEKPDLFSIPVVPSSDVIALERKRFTDGYFNGVLNNKVTYPVLSPVVEILAKQKSGEITMDEANRQIAVYENHDIRSDINKHLLQTAIAQQYALNLSGGANKFQYYGSVGYDHSRPNDINITDDRLTFVFDNTWTPVKNLNINARLNWNQSTQQSKNQLFSYNTILTNPYLRLADENGNALAIPKTYRITYADTAKFPGKLDWLYRPLDEAGNGNRLTKGYNTDINTSVSYTLLQGLKIDAGYNWQKRSTDMNNVESISIFTTRDLINRYAAKSANGLPVYPYPLGAIYNQDNSELSSWSVRANIAFNRSFGKHNIVAFAGIDRNESKSRSVTMPTQYGYNIETNVFAIPQPGNWSTRPGGSTGVIRPQTARLRGNLTRFGSYYANIGYTYNQKYTFTASGRVDESNFFGVEANDRKKPLWSAGMKWDISKEQFYNIDQLPTLSFRGTYGYSGNVNAGTSPFATVVYRSPLDDILLPFAVIQTPPNPELRWENVRTINFALDFEIKNRRVSGILDFYHKKGIDLVSLITVDPTSGFAAYTGNNSRVQTKGIDLKLDIRNIEGLFKWYSTLNFAYQKDKVIAYSVEPPKFGRTVGIFIGKPLSSMYSYPWAGLNPLNGDVQAYINGQIVGSNGYTNKVKQADMIYNGQTSPPVFGSFFNNFSYKNLSLSIGIGYQFGHYFRRASYSGGNFYSSSWQHNDYLKAWKAPGDELKTNVPGFLDSYNDDRWTVYKDLDILAEKGDHIRLRDIKLNYSLNKDLLKRVPFKMVTFYLYANNLGIVWKASRYNPDTQNGLASPIQKTIAGGLNISF